MTHRPHPAPWPQPVFQPQATLQPQSVRHLPRTHRNSRIPESPQPSGARSHLGSPPRNLGPRRRHHGPQDREPPWRSRPELARVPRQRQSREKVRHPAVLRSVASRVFRRRQVLQYAPPSRTTRLRFRRREEVGWPVRSMPPPAHLAPLVARFRPWHVRLWTSMPCRVAVGSGRSAAVTEGRLAWRLRPPRWSSCPYATEPSPAGRRPRSGRVEIRLGPAWARYRGPATPETDPPSTFHRPVLIPGRHRARSSRPRVILPRCRPSPWCSPAATPASPTYPALVPLRLPAPWPSAAAVQVRPGAC